MGTISIIVFLIGIVVALYSTYKAFKSITDDYNKEMERLNEIKDRFKEEDLNQ